MSTKAEIHDKIEKDLKPRKKKLEDEHKELLPKIQQAAFALPGAIERNNEPVIKFYRDAWQKGTEHWANMLSRTDRLISELQELAKDEGVLEDFDEVQTLTEQLSELRRIFNKDFGIGKTQLDAANDALEQHQKSASDATEKVALMEAWLRKHLEIFKQRLAQIQAARENARKAVAARNEKALADAIKASSELVEAEPTFDDLQITHEGFCKKCESQGLSKAQQDELARDRKAFDQIMDDLSATTAKIVATDVEIEAMEIPGVDMKKAAALLKIPSSQEAKLKKALESGAGMEKALDALAKELKLNTTGKAMIAALKKAKLM